MYDVTEGLLRKCWVNLCQWSVPVDKVVMTAVKVQGILKLQMIVHSLLVFLSFCGNPTQHALLTLFCTCNGDENSPSGM